jgi:hypothetical protein
MAQATLRDQPFTPFAAIGVQGRMEATAADPRSTIFDLNAAFILSHDSDGLEPLHEQLEIRLHRAHAGEAESSLTILVPGRCLGPESELGLVTADPFDPSGCGVQVLFEAEGGSFPARDVTGRLTWLKAKLIGPSEPHLPWLFQLDAVFVGADDALPTSLFLEFGSPSKTLIAIGNDGGESFAKKLIFEQLGRRPGN